MTSAITPFELNNIRAQLLSEKQRLLKSEKEFVKSELDRLDVRTDLPSNRDETSEAESLETEIAMEEHVLKTVAGIDLALSRIEAQQYGICLDCGELIPEERLKAFPAAARCVKCKSLFETGTVR